MKTRAVLLVLAFCLVGVGTAYAADDAFMGTWKLNEAKSKIGTGATKNTTVVYAMSGDSVKVTTDGTGADGAAIHIEWTGKFDSKEYPVTGDPTADMRSYKKVNDHTLEITNKKGGKVTNTGRIVVSPDGKTRTVTVHGTDAKGMKTTSVAVYDKQ